MKKIFYFIFIITVILSIYIINNNLNSSSQEKIVNLIVSTKNVKSEDDIYKLIFDKLKTIDSKVDVKVKKIESDTFTVDINTKLNEDEVIDKLSNVKDFKYVQVNYDLKAKSK